MNWHDLSGSELIARLTQRGVPLVAARALVRDRDTEYAARLISKVLRR